MVPCTANPQTFKLLYITCKSRVENLWLPQNSHNYVAGQGDLVSRLIMSITRVAMWVIGAINLLTTSR